MPGRFEGKVALVTGGASGIGRATALTFAREGAKLIIADMNEDGGQQTVHMIQEDSGDATFVQVDVSNSTEIEELISKTVEIYGKLDCAFNNAGIEGSLGLPAEYSEAEWERVLRINLTGVWLCMKYEIRQMLQQRTGAIVNTASIMGLVGEAMTPAYVASKHGVVGLTKSASLAYARAGIRVNAVCPGFIESAMTERVFSLIPEHKDAIVARHPIGRMGRSTEIAEAVVWLCSDAASFITGHTMTVDGGYVAQ